MALSACPQPVRGDFSARAARRGVTAPTAGPATPELEHVTARGGGEGGIVTNVSEGLQPALGRALPKPQTLGSLGQGQFSRPRSAALGCSQGWVFGGGGFVPAAGPDGVGVPCSLPAGPLWRGLCPAVPLSPGKALPPPDGRLRMSPGIHRPRLRQE